MNQKGTIRQIDMQVYLCTLDLSLFTQWLEGSEGDHKQTLKFCIEIIKLKIALKSSPWPRTTNVQFVIYSYPHVVAPGTKMRPQKEFQVLHRSV